MDSREFETFDELEEEEMEEIKEEVEEPEPEENDQFFQEEEEDYFEEVSEGSPESRRGWSGSELLEESEDEDNVFIDDIDEFQSSPSEGESTSVMKVTNII